MSKQNELGCSIYTKLIRHDVSKFWKSGVGNLFIGTSFLTYISFYLSTFPCLI